MRKHRTKKLSVKDRRAIIMLWDSGEYTQTEIARMFFVSVPRICQIVNYERADYE